MRGLILVLMSNVCYLVVIWIFLVVTAHYLVVTARYLVATGGYCSLLEVTVVTARYCLFSLVFDYPFKFIFGGTYFQQLSFFTTQPTHKKLLQNETMFFDKIMKNLVTIIRGRQQLRCLRNFPVTVEQVIIIPFKEGLYLIINRLFLAAQDMIRPQLVENLVIVCFYIVILIFNYQLFLYQNSVQKQEKNGKSAF